MTTADQLVAILATGGVKPINGIVGDSLNGIYRVDPAARQDRLAAWPARRRRGFRGGRRSAADREIAVCAAGCAAGDLHLINGLFDCPSPAGSRA